jgi:hypothetical protein
MRFTCGRHIPTAHTGGSFGRSILYRPDEYSCRPAGLVLRFDWDPGLLTAELATAIPAGDDDAVSDRTEVYSWKFRRHGIVGFRVFIRLFELCELASGPKSFFKAASLGHMRQDGRTNGKPRCLRGQNLPAIGCPHGPSRQAGRLASRARRGARLASSTRRPEVRRLRFAGCDGVLGRGVLSAQMRPSLSHRCRRATAIRGQRPMPDSPGYPWRPEMVQCGRFEFRRVTYHRDAI